MFWRPSSAAMVSPIEAAGPMTPARASKRLGSKQLFGPVTARSTRAGGGNGNLRGGLGDFNLDDDDDEEEEEGGKFLGAEDRDYTVLARLGNNKYYYQFPRFFSHKKAVKLEFYYCNELVVCNQLAMEGSSTLSSGGRSVAVSTGTTSGYCSFVLGSPPQR